MKKCSGNNFEGWGFDGIFDIECPHCGNLVEFFKDEIKRRCSQCKKMFTIIADIMVVGSGVHLHLPTQEIFVLNLGNQSLCILDTISDYYNAFKVLKDDLKTILNLVFEFDSLRSLRHR